MLGLLVLAIATKDSKPSEMWSSISEDVGVAAKRRKFFGPIAIVSLLLFLASDSLIGGVDVVAIRGDDAPDGNGKYSGFGVPAISDVGEVAFAATFTETENGSVDNSGMARESLNKARSAIIARAGDAPPDGDGVFSYMFFFVDPLINNQGRVCFPATVLETESGLSESGVYVGEASGEPLSQLFRTGNTVPGGNGEFNQVFAAVGNSRSINDSGVVFSFIDGIRNTAQPGMGNSGGFTASESSEDVLFRTGQALPSGGAITFLVFSSGINSSGQVAIHTSFSTTQGDSGIYLFDDSGAAVIARRGTPSPDGNGSLFGLARNIRPPVLNDNGQVLFCATISGSSGGTSDNTGIFLGDGSELFTIARQGAVPPEGNGKFAGLLGMNRYWLNNHGDVVFLAPLSDTSGGAADDMGVYVKSASDMTKIVREGEASPDGNGVLSVLGRPEISDSGHVALFVELDQTNNAGNGDTEGILVYHRDDGVKMVVRTGQELGGATITEIEMNPADIGHAVFRRALNNQGKVAFKFVLDDSRQGIAIWSPPAFAIDSIARNNDSVGVNIQSKIGYSYTLEYKENIEDPGWSSIEPSMNGTGDTQTLTDDDPGSANRYYRVREE